MPAAEVPADTQLQGREFPRAKMGAAYTSPTTGAWSRPGPRTGPFKATLTDGSVVTYSWYRFVDQPSFQQYDWDASEEGRAASLRGKDPRELADRPRLHATSQSRALS